MTLWGVPVVETDILTEGTGLVGDFTAHSQLWYRQGVEVLAGYVGTQFTEGEQTIRASFALLSLFIDRKHSRVSQVYKPVAIQ